MVLGRVVMRKLSASCSKYYICAESLELNQIHSGKLRLCRRHCYLTYLGSACRSVGRSNDWRRRMFHEALFLNDQLEEGLSNLRQFGFCGITVWFGSSRSDHYGTSGGDTIPEHESRLKRRPEGLYLLHTVSRLLMVLVPPRQNTKGLL